MSDGELAFSMLRKLMVEGYMETTVRGDGSRLLVVDSSAEISADEDALLDRLALDSEEAAELECAQCGHVGFVWMQENFESGGSQTVMLRCAKCACHVWLER